MTFFDRFKKICNEQNIKISKLEQDIGLSRGASYKWKKSSPSKEVLERLSKYLNVSVDYLINGKEKEWQPTITEKEEKDLDRKVENLLNAVDSDTGLMLDGQVMDDETREIFAMNLKNALRTTKLAAKAKYTPKKYRE